MLPHRLFNACASLCYSAFFWGAITTLEHEGIRREKWSHGGLKQAFALELITRRNLYSRRFGELLGDAYDLRDIAHYKRKDVSGKKEERMVHHAHEFLAQIEEVL